jgi:small subunit ribosomal protein S6
VAIEQRRRDYETMVVLRADLQEAGVKEQLGRFAKVLEAEGAAIRGIHDWGLRELAYPIRKERRGFYAVVEYTSTATAVLEVERQLKLSDLVLRFVSVRQEHAIQTGPALQPESGEATETAGSGSADAEANEFEA